MTAIPVIVGYVLREALRRRVFAVVLVLTVVFLVLYWLANHYVHNELRTLQVPQDVPVDARTFASAFLTGLAQGRGYRANPPQAQPYYDRMEKLEKELLAATTDTERAGLRTQLREVETMNAFFIVPTSVKSMTAELFATHPPLEKRLARLAEIAREMGKPVA